MESSIVSELFPSMVMLYLDAFPEMSLIVRNLPVNDAAAIRLIVVSAALFTRISLSDASVVYGLEVTDVDGVIVFKRPLRFPLLVLSTYSTSPSSM